MTATAQSKILKGLDQIRNFINPENPLSRETVIDMIKLGLPVRLIGNTYYATTHNLVAWFNEKTWVDMSKAPDEMLRGGE